VARASVSRGERSLKPLQQFVLLPRQLPSLISFRWQTFILQAIVSSLFCAKQNSRRIFVPLLAWSCLVALPVGPCLAQATSQSAPATTLEDPCLEPPSPVLSEGAERLAQELALTAERHGPDSVALQASLLVSSMRAGAVGTTQVRVVGASTRTGTERLRIEVETGLEFADQDTTAQQRADRIWNEVVAPVLERMESFDIRPGSLELEVFYTVSTDLDSDSDANLRAVAFEIDASVLEDLVLKMTTPEAVRAAGGGDAEHAGADCRAPKPPTE